MSLDGVFALFDFALLEAESVFFVARAALTFSVADGAASASGVGSDWSGSYRRTAGVNFAQTKVLRRGDRVDAATESRFDRSFRNPKRAVEGFDEAKKPRRRNAALGDHCYLTSFDRGANFRNERENAISHSTRGAVQGVRKVLRSRSSVIRSRPFLVDR